MNSKCPLLSVDLHDSLSEISVEGYIKEKSYYYSIDGKGSNDVHRYNMAIERAVRMFNCPIMPTLSPELFNYNNQNTTQNTSRAKRRKAYWAHLSKELDNNAQEDSKSDAIQAADFITTLSKYYHDITYSNKPVDLTMLEKLLLNNLGLANAIDMYQYCFIRQLQEELLENNRKDEK
jgi:hypothetical protein